MRSYLAIILLATMTGCVSLEQSTCHRCRDCQSVACCTGCTTSESKSSCTNSAPPVATEGAPGADQQLHELSDRRAAALDLQATDQASSDERGSQPFEPVAPQVTERVPLVVPRELETHLRYHQPEQRTAAAGQPDSAALSTPVNFFALANEQPALLDNSEIMPEQEPSKETPQRVRRIPIEAIRDSLPDVMPAAHADATSSEPIVESTDVSERPGHLSRTRSSRRTLETSDAQ